MDKRKGVNTMSLPEVIGQYLRRHHMIAQEHEHRATYTAHQLADVEQIPETQVAKVVFFFCDDQLMMGVLPANRHLNLHQVRHVTGADMVRLATEREIARHCDTVELGAIPPFGSIFGLPVVLDQTLEGAIELEIPGGRHTESIRVHMKDFLREESPRIMPLSRAPIRHRRPEDRPRPMDYF